MVLVPNLPFLFRVSPKIELFSGLLSGRYIPGRPLSVRVWCIFTSFTLREVIQSELYSGIKD
jgi:hypothetical protein